MDDETTNTDETKGWFDRPENVNKLVRFLFVGCGIFILIDLIFLISGYDKHPYLRWEKWPGFYAVYAFVCCVVLVLISKYLLRPLVMRDEDHYAPKEEQEGGNDA